MRNAFFKNNLLNFGKNAVFNPKWCDTEFATMKMFSGKNSRKTRGYNKKWLRRSKRQFPTQNGLKT